jgi:hypothetical protein
VSDRLLSSFSVRFSSELSSESLDLGDLLAAVAARDPLRIALRDDRRMLTAPLLSMFVIPAAYLLMRRRSYSSNERKAP